MLDLIGLEWPTTEIVWNDYNPHPGAARPAAGDRLRRVGQRCRGRLQPREIRPASGLQQLVAIFAGLLRPKGGGDVEFTPLLKTSDRGGTVGWSEMTRQGFMGISGLNPNPRHSFTGKPYTLAARLQGTPAPRPTPDKARESQEEGDRRAEKPAKINAIAIADLDLISEQFFELRRQKVENLELDNVTFVLNCVDVLAGDESFVALRKRRLKHRTLRLLEDQVAKFDRQRQGEIKAAEESRRGAAQVAKDRFTKQVDEAARAARTSTSAPRRSC